MLGKWQTPQVLWKMFPFVPGKDQRSDGTCWEQRKKILCYKQIKFHNPLMSTRNKHQNYFYNIRTLSQRQARIQKWLWVIFVFLQQQTLHYISNTTTAFTLILRGSRIDFSWFSCMSSRSNWMNLKILVFFVGGGKLENPEKSNQARWESRTNSNHIWHQGPVSRKTW